jgi:hypothetical protein
MSEALGGPLFGFVITFVDSSGKRSWLEPALPNGDRIPTRHRETAEVFATRSEAHIAIGTLSRRHKFKGATYSVEPVTYPTHDRVLPQFWGNSLIDLDPNDDDP